MLGAGHEPVVVDDFDAASDDGAIIKVTYSDGLTLYDAVAMLSFAQATVFTDHVPEEQR